jgi:hypothetical protein
VKTGEGGCGGTDGIGGGRRCRGGGERTKEELKRRGVKMGEGGCGGTDGIGGGRRRQRGGGGGGLGLGRKSKEGKVKRSGAMTRSEL